MSRVLDLPISRCRPSEDVVPFSECRNNLSMYITRVRETHRPVLITQNGRAASYLVDAESLAVCFIAIAGHGEPGNIATVGRELGVLVVAGVVDEVVFSIDRLVFHCLGRLNLRFNIAFGLTEVLSFTLFDIEEEYV